MRNTSNHIYTCIQYLTNHKYSISHILNSIMTTAGNCVTQHKSQVLINDLWVIQSRWSFILWCTLFCILLLMCSSKFHSNQLNINVNSKSDCIYITHNLFLVIWAKQLKSFYTLWGLVILWEQEALSYSINILSNDCYRTYLKIISANSSMILANNSAKSRILY